MANKDKEILYRRAIYVQQRVNKVINKRKEIKDIANELFLSERTIWNDSNKELPKDCY